MKANIHKINHQPRRYKTVTPFQKFEEFLKRNGVQNHSERLPQILGELHHQALNKHLIARAMNDEAAEVRRKRKTESPKARSNNTTTEAEG